MIRTASAAAEKRTARPDNDDVTETSQTVAAQQLRAFIERIERLHEEAKTIGDDLKEVYLEAKGTGFDTKAMKTIVKLRKKDPAERQEEEAILDLYMSALGMVPGEQIVARPPARVHTREREGGARDVFDEMADREFSDNSPVKVYFLAADSAGLIKIGSTEAVERRIAAIRRGSPVPVSLIGVISGGAKLELELHQRFAEHRVHGEWFANVIRPEIDGLCAATITQFPVQPELNFPSIASVNPSGHARKGSDDANAGGDHEGITPDPIEKENFEKIDEDVTPRADAEALGSSVEFGALP